MSELLEATTVISLLFKWGQKSTYAFMQEEGPEEFFGFAFPSSTLPEYHLLSKSWILFLHIIVQKQQLKLFSWGTSEDYKKTINQQSMCVWGKH